MAYALRYYKEFTHADGKVIRLEIHKKDSTTAAVEIGAVVQGLSLQIQGQQGDIDTPIVKTSLSMTFVDAGDIENGQKNGFWEEFYTPDSVLWKVLVKAKKAGETAFTTIWGGYVTPDSFSESLTYRGSVNIIARDNIGHMQDFPFDAEGDEDGMISLYDLVNTAWAKIESPMSLMWDGGHWMQCEGVNGYNTLMNVSAFEGMSWYEAVEKALYSYGGVMRYIGGNEVLVTTLRYMPTFGRNIDRLPRIEPTFITGATRELVPAVKRVEESVKYELNKDYQQKIDLIDFSGNVYDVQTDWGTVDDIAWGLMASSPMAPFGWYNEVPYKTLAFNPKAYEIDDTISESDREDIHGNTCILTGTKDDDTYSLSYAMTVGPEDFAINIKFGRFLTRWTNLAGEHSLGFPTNFFGAEYKVRFAVKVVSNGITSYLAQNGEWVEEQATQQVTVTGDSMSVNVPLSGVFTGNVQVSFVFLNIDTGDDAVRILQILGMSLSDISTKPMLETNTVNTNYQEGNNVVLSRDPEIAPAYNTVALPAFIKNGIFRREGSRILPAYKWGWSGSTPQQMAVYNHLQLLAYYAKPNNLISGTIVNADVTDIACIYEWHHADHILVSGNLNLLNGHIEGAMLREYARYEYLWADVEGAGFPETEQASTTNVEGGASAGGSSSTYTNNTTVNIGTGGGGGGASYLGDLQDVDVTGVVAQSVLYYNGTSWVDMSIHTLLNPYVKGEDLNVVLAEINAEIEKRALDSDLDTLAGRVGVNELAIADNAGNIKNNFDAIEALGSSKADKATTLAGYGITDAYTTEEIDGKVTAINNAIALKADTTALEALAVSVDDNAANIRNLKDSVYTKEDLATYKSWWDDLMGLIVKEGSDIKINGNLIVAGDTSTGGTGSNPEVAGTLIGIKVNGQTYNNPVNGILTIPDYPTSLEWSAINGKPTKLSEFLNDSGFITSAALVGYATQSWVEGNGYITGITLTGDDYISVKGYQLSLAIDAQGGLTNTGQGLGIYQIPSAKIVTDALGYTPANNASLANYLPLSGGIIDGNITLRAASSSTDSWLNFTDKGTSEEYAIGIRRPTASYGLQFKANGDYYKIYHSGNFNPADYLPLSGGKMTGTITVGDFTAFGQTGGNFYLGTPAYPLLLRSNGTSTINGNTLIHSGNIVSYKAGDSALLQGLPSGRFLYHSNMDAPDPDVTDGNWVGMTNIHTPDSNYMHILSLNWGDAVSVNQHYWAAQLAMPTQGRDNLYYRSEYDGTSWRPWRRIVTEDDYGNVPIPRKLFIVGNVGIGTTDPQYKLDVNGTARISGAVTMSSTLTVEGGATVSGTLNGTQIQLSNNIPLIFTNQGSGTYTKAVVEYTASGFVFERARKTDSASGEIIPLIISQRGGGAAVTFSGNNLIVSGDTATGSDIRFKDKITDHRIALSDIAQAPLFTFKWNDREDDSVHLGSSAQYWEGVAPWLVKGTDFKVLDYSTLGVAIGISLANKALNHEERIKILERENEQLKEQIRRIQYGS